jgi:RimJ/RimL family protein N-acetyltransferase
VTVIETPRLRLRKTRWRDYTALCKILRDADVMYAWEGPYSHAQVFDWIKRHRRNDRKYGFSLWAVVLKETGEMIGQCGIKPLAYQGEQVLELGYLFRKAFWHKGYATEAAMACRDYAFETLEADEVFSTIRDTNTASQNVARRCGMTRKGEFVKYYRGVDMPHYAYAVKRTGTADI